MTSKQQQPAAAPPPPPPSPLLPPPNLSPKNFFFGGQPLREDITFRDFFLDQFLHGKEIIRNQSTVRQQGPSSFSHSLQVLGTEEAVPSSISYSPSCVKSYPLLPTTTTITSISCCCFGCIDL
eukprot:TRINITY_DN14372_c1_g1_i1.p1 TRINITY_DN14372_c1_g1~~TRINITY_DN14372_c1_g1_i1.p1  ORF type:complete len:123 (+),score=27.89 TRINITY_DN14372_c1_g1_i1:150-518(+)